MDTFLLRSGSDWLAAPLHSPCPKCGKSMAGADGKCASAYLSGGSLLMSDDRNGGPDERLSAYLYAGVFDQKKRIGFEKPGIRLVENLDGGQFTLQWCSVACMRDWFLALFAEIEREFTTP